MSAQTYNLDVLNPLFKQTYADAVEDAIPERELLLRSIPFVSAEKQNGANYNQPVLLTRHHGVSYLGNGASTENMQLKAPIAAVTLNAEIRGSGMMMTGLLSTMAASRAMKGGPSFVDATSYLVEGLVDSFSAVHEQTMFYGGVGLATISDATYLNTNATTDAAGGFGSGTVVYNSGTPGVTLQSNMLVVAYAEWAPAVWVGAENMLVDIVRGNAVIATLTIKAVDIVNRILTFQSIAGYTPADGDVIYRNGAFNFEAKGLQYILQQQGVLFGIDNAQWGLWAGSSYDTNGSLSYTKVAEAVSIAYGKGLEGDLDLHVNSKTFAELIPDFNTAKTAAGVFPGRMFTSESEVADIVHGARAIRFVVNNISTRVIANDYVKAGLAFAIAPSTFLRVGSSEMTFDIPGRTEKGEYFREVSGFAAVELRMFSDQALFCKAPARNLILVGLEPKKS